MKWLALVLLVALAGCAEAEPLSTHYQLQFDAFDDRGKAISGVGVAVGETKIGTTTSTGILRVEVNASKGERFPLHMTCPENYAKSETPEHIVFRDTKGLAGEEHARIHVKLECARLKRVAALLVHADGRPGLPILIDGVEQGRTGPGGFAHLRLDLPPGSQFQVGIDSSEHPSLRPIDPKRTMTQGTEDGLFVFDPVFSEVQPEKKKRRRRKRVAAPELPVKKRPVRID